MSAAIIVGFFLFFGGIALLIKQLRDALAARTLNDALMPYLLGVLIGVVMTGTAISLKYSPPWRGIVSTVIAYAVIVYAIGVLIAITRKPKE